jgi:hypothetical protein
MTSINCPSCGSSISHYSIDVIANGGYVAGRGGIICPACNTKITNMELTILVKSKQNYPVIISTKDYVSRPVIENSSRISTTYKLQILFECERCKKESTFEKIIKWEREKEILLQAINDGTMPIYGKCNYCNYVQSWMIKNIKHIPFVILLFPASILTVISITMDIMEYYILAIGLIFLGVILAPIADYFTRNNPKIITVEYALINKLIKNIDLIKI